MATEVPEAKVDLVTQEIELTKLLASNDPRTISDGIKQIKQLLLKNSEDTSDAFQLNNYLVIWKGLFYFMWTSDKPVPQESVTEQLSYLIHSCTSYQGKIFFLDAFFLTIKDNWMSIRQHRIDACMMWVRHCLKQLLFTFVNCDWNLEYMNKFSEVLYRALKSFTPSLRTQIQVIFLEELAKVSRGKVPTEALVIILDSFLHYISELNDVMLIKEVTQNVFRNLLSPSPDLETLEAKFQASQKIIDSSNLNNDLVEGDIAKNKANELNENPLDPQVENVSVEIPRINFNPKDVAKVLNKYLTKVDCTRKCLWEITKLIQFYNRLGACFLTCRPKDLKTNSQVLKHKKKKYLSKMVKDGVKRLEMVDSRIKKSGLEVHDHKSFKELTKMGEIVKVTQNGKPMWKVRKSNKINTLKKNFNLNGSWTVSKDTQIDGNNTVCMKDGEQPLIVPVGFNVEVLETSEKPLTKLQKKVSLNPNFKCLTFNSSLKESNSNKRKSKSQITQMNDGSKKKNIIKKNSLFIKIGTPNALNASHKNSLSISADHGGSVSKHFENNTKSAKALQLVNSPFNIKSLTLDNKIGGKNQINDEPLFQAPAEFNVEASETLEKKLTKLQEKVSLNPNFKSVSVDSNLKELTKMGEIVKGTQNGKSMWKVRKSDKIDTLKENFNLNGSWTVSKDTQIDGNNTVCMNDGEQPLMVPVGFNVEVLETSEKPLTKLQKKVSLNPNFKSVSVESNLKELTKMGEIVKSTQNGKSMWKVRKSDKINTLKENFNLNGSWTVSKDTKIDGNNTVCMNDGEQPLMVPVGFNVEVLETSEKPLTKLQKKVSLNPNFKSVLVDSNLKELTKMGEIVKGTQNGKSMWKVRKSDKINTLKENSNLNGSWTVSKDTKIDGNNTVCMNDGEQPLMVPVGFNVEVLETSEKPLTKLQKKVSLTPSLTCPSVDSSIKEFNKPGEIVLEQNFNLNGSWTVSKNTKIDGKTTVCMNDDFVTPILVPPGFNVEVLESSEKTSTKVQNKVSVTSHNNSWYLSADNDGSASNIIKESNPSIRVQKDISFTSVITPDKSSKSLKLPTAEHRVLPQTTTTFSKNKPDGKNEGTPISKVKATSATRVLRKCRKTTTGKAISMLKPKDISNKALKKVRSEAFENGFGSLRKSPRLAIKATRELQNCRKTTEGEEISMLIPEDISNKALEKVRSEAFEDGFGSLRKSPRLAIKTTRELQNCRKTTEGEEISMLIPEDISNKALEKVRSEAFEDGFGSLRRSPRLAIKTTRELQNCRKTTEGEEISMLIPEDISNKALEKVRSEAFEDGFGSLRKSPRLAIKTTRELQNCRKTTEGEEISMLIPEDISNKALEKVRSEAFEDGFGSLRKSPRLAIKTTRELQNCRKTTEGEEISMLIPEDISNKALEKVQSEAFEDGFGSLRKSPRLAIKTTRELQNCRKTTEGEEISMLIPEDISNKALEKVRSEAFEDGFGSLRRSPRLAIKTTRELQNCRKTTEGEEISMLIPEDISNKALEKVRSEAFEDGFGSLRKSPRLAIKTTRELQNCRKTTEGEEISMLIPEDISNKALEKVQSEAFEDGFGFLRKSPRLSFKTDSAKKIVEYQC
ncbi:uncharacterized protein LOC132942180 [Metopolophium dirhodum]|uniref:uncharacterized protein LOC132942180 n=1 Tax=Metopolophium dirhodum TaxID=44670 RepID=UPI0029904131|nr:uncharacterized protein LOC132942180 [Metopolophium dirhodum]